MNPGNLSPLSLFLEAGIVGKAVILILFLASIRCWLLILEAWVAARRLSRAVIATRGGEAESPLVAPILESGAEAASIRVAAEMHSDRRWRVGEQMTRAARGLLLQAEGPLAGLATISSTAPFIGLFGTVWGIMSSFSNIAEAKDTSLAVVAPGIAEALAATAFGLAAAIPASIGFNRLSARFTRVSAELDCLVQERADLLVRDEARTSARVAA